MWVDYESSANWSTLLFTLPASNFVVTDGQKGMRLAIKSSWPSTIIQRCLFHVWPNIRTKLTLNPRSQAGIELLMLFKTIWEIKIYDQSLNWIKQFQILSLRHGDFIRERTVVDKPEPGQRRWWYTHIGVRSAYRQLAKLIKDDQLFVYSADGDVPRTTNYLEGGINAPIRQPIRQHKGLRLNKQIALVNYYLYSRTEV